MRIPLLYRCEYSQWRERFMNYLEEQTDGEAMINSIQNGDQPLPVIAQVSLVGTAQNARPTLKDPKFWTAEEKKTRKIDRLAISLLIQGLSNDIYSLIDSNETAKDLWDALERYMRGSEYGEQDRKATILYEYETFKASEGEQLLDTYWELEDFKNKNKSLESSNNYFKEANNRLSETNNLLYTDYKKSEAELARRNRGEYASQIETECAKVRGDFLSYKIEYQKSCTKYTQTINDLNQTILEMKDKLSAHQKTISILSQQKEAHIKLYKTQEDKELDKVIELENKVKVLDNIVYKTGQSVQTMNMLNNKCRTRFAKPEFLKKAQRANPRLYDIEKRMDESIPLDKKCQSSIEIFKVNTIINGVELCKEKIANETYSGYIDPFIQKTIKANFSPVISRINAGLEQFHSHCTDLPPNKKSILKNTNVLASEMYKVHTESNQTRTSQLPQDSRKTNKHVSFSTGVIPTTSVSRSQLKSNPMGDRVMRNNSQGKNQEVEDHRRSVKFSKNNTSVTECNNSLNAKTLNINSVCATCDTCVMNDKHDMCVLNSVAKPIKKIVASESNQKPRNITRKLYERISVPLCQILHSLLILLELVEIVLFIIDSRCSKHMTGNLKLLINFVGKFLRTVKSGNDQIAPILGYGDLKSMQKMIKFQMTSLPTSFVPQHKTKGRRRHVMLIRLICTLSINDIPLNIVGKKHPLEQVIRNPSQSVKTRRQLESDVEMCMFTLIVSRTEPKNIKEAMADSAWIESMQEELHQFDRLD
nr:integrase, catalytic region, zinc finger, CCHC-type, peptidase aspartic, catalytic [Tanacetum cinerariifolium]